MRGSIVRVSKQCLCIIPGWLLIHQVGPFDCAANVGQSSRKGACVMKSQTAPESQLASSMIVETASLLNRMEEMHQEIALRAYELFEERSREDGHDHEDWLRAESEL